MVLFTVHPVMLQEYARRAAALRHHALTTGTITYQEVLDAAYPPGTVSSDVLHSKAKWRTSLGPGFVFTTDYSSMHDAATVRSLVAAANPNLQSMLVAQYESTSHMIGIASVATDFAIFHEAGHALQRTALQARGVAPGRQTGTSHSSSVPVLPADAADATTLRRLQYLCSQDEFEVRLQDLNRFHALLVAGRPILNATDSIRALSALGLPLTFAETRDAFALGGQTLSQDQFAQHIACTPMETAAISVAFEDARELRLMRRLMLRIDPTCWPQLLAKIIFEAPGHL